MQRNPNWLTFVSGIFVGLAFGAYGTAYATDLDKTYAKLRVFGQVLSYVQSNYVDDVTEDELVYDAISGLLTDLDPHSVFMRPEEYRKLREDTAGEFGGLGIGIYEPSPGHIVVESVRPDGAADRAGIKPLDRILAVDGEAIKDIGALSDVSAALRGVAGTKVVTRIKRASWKIARDITLVRRRVRVDSVQSALLPGDYGYVRIFSFQERTDSDLGAALTRLQKSARSKNLQGLVLDLRDNPGGLLDEGVKVADRFIAKGDIVSTKGRNHNNDDIQRAHKRGTQPPYPVRVLINGGSASASEIVAGALQDHKRAKLVGQRSYGKGSVQTLFGLDDGSGLKLTIARYFTPSGRSIQGSGIEPDIPVMPDADRAPYAAAADTDAQIAALMVDADVSAALQSMVRK